jgi:hypothetical protein
MDLLQRLGSAGGDVDDELVREDRGQVPVQLRMIIDKQNARVLNRPRKGLSTIVLH